MEDIIDTEFIGYHKQRQISDCLARRCNLDDISKELVSRSIHFADVIPAIRQP